MTARQITDDYEVIVVNDASPDHTGELLDEMARHFPWLQVVHHPRTAATAARCARGFAAATKDLVFYTDGDAQYDPRELLKLSRPSRPTWTSSTATRSAAPTPCTASSSAASTTGSCGRCSACACATWTATSA